MLRKLGKFAPLECRTSECFNRHPEAFSMYHFNCSGVHHLEEIRKEGLPVPPVNQIEVCYSEPVSIEVPDEKIFNRSSCILFASRSLSSSTVKSTE